MSKCFKIYIPHIRKDSTIEYIGIHKALSLHLLIFYKKKKEKKCKYININIQTLS